MEPTLGLVVLFKANPGKQAALVEAIRVMQEATRQEVGCNLYDLHQDVDDPSHLVLVEDWQTVADWERHMQMPHLQAFGRVRDELVAELQLIKTRKIS